MALNNIKDPVTTVTMSYRIIQKPEPPKEEVPPAVDETTTDEAPADTSEPPADGAARRRRILYTKMQNTTTDDSEEEPDLNSRKSRILVEDKLIDQHTELIQKSIPPELLDCEQTNE